MTETFEVGDKGHRLPSTATMVLCKGDPCGRCYLGEKVYVLTEFTPADSFATWRNIWKPENEA